jgi:transposase
MRRRQAVAAVQRGDSVADVARIFGVSHRTVQRWLEQARSPGGVAAKPHPGPKTKLTSEQEQELVRLLEMGSKAHGWDNELWTTKRIAVLIQRTFGVRMHHDHIGRFLRERLKWTSKKPRFRATERNDAAIQQWKEKEFPRIALEAAERGAHLVFLDESGFMLNPTVRRTWAPKGRTPVIDCPQRRDKISVISVVSVSPKAGRLNFHFELLPDKQNFGAEQVVAFLKTLRRQLGGPFTVIWDGARIHARAKLVKEFLAEHPEIVQETLPAYAPELNPDEGAWSWTKYGRLANLAAENTKVLRERMMEAFAELRRDWRLLGSFIAETELKMAA